MVAQIDAEKRSEQALLGERLPDAKDAPVEVCSLPCTTMREQNATDSSAPDA